MQLILYSKPGCHLCEGLQEKLENIVKIGTFPALELEIIDITTRSDWFNTYQYEVPVLYLITDYAGAKDTEEDKVTEGKQLLPRPSPRATVQQLQQMLQKYGGENESK